MITVLCHREKTPWLKHRTQVLNYAVQGDGRKKKPVSLSNEKEQQSRGGKGQNKLENWSVCDFFWLRKLRKWCSNKHKWKIIKSWPTQYDLSDPTVSPQHWFQFCVKQGQNVGTGRDPRGGFKQSWALCQWLSLQMLLRAPAPGQPRCRQKQLPLGSSHLTLTNLPKPVLIISSPSPASFLEIRKSS